MKVLFFTKRPIYSCLILIFISMKSYAQVIPLYTAEVPGLKSGIKIQEENTSKDAIIRLRNVTVPTLTIFIPKKNTSNAAVIICPGGGYSILAFNHEGTNIGEWFAERGITAFVLKYRLPQTELFENAEIRPLEDVQEAMRYLRKNASKYNLNPEKIGVMGFSAGGHLAAMAANKFNDIVGENKDLSINLKPNFSILIYPVISFSDKIGHLGSRTNLIGKNPSIEKIDAYSMEKKVTSLTPPTFLIHAIDDNAVPIENSLEYLLALKKHNVKVEAHLFDNGGHGFSMKKTNTGTLSVWDKRLEEWLKFNKWM